MLSWRSVWLEARALHAALFEDCGRLFAPCALLDQLQFTNTQLQALAHPILTDASLKRDLFLQRA